MGGGGIISQEGAVTLGKVAPEIDEIQHSECEVEIRLHVKG